MDFSTLLHGFVKVASWICYSCYVGLSKLLHVFCALCSKGVEWVKVLTAESVVPLAFGNVYFLSQKRPKSISNKGLSPYCNKKIGILTISSVSPELQHSDCVDWMYSELEIREKSPLSGLPFEVGPPLISYTKTQMHHWRGQLKLQDIIFSHLQ